MFRSQFELERQVRDRMEEIARDRSQTSAIVAPGAPPAHPRWRRSAGVALIRIGQRLSGETAGLGIGAPRAAA